MNKDNKDNKDNQIELEVTPTEDIKKFWNDFSAMYSSNLEKGVLPFYFNLLCLINADKATSQDKILELSIGGGIGFFNLINNTEAEVYGGDLCEEMLKISKKRVDSYGNNTTNKKINLSLINNEDLSKFEDNTFRSILSNMSLQIVENPLQMLKECYRVLDKNNKEAKCAFSVWGRKENNPFHNLIPGALKKNNISLPQKRSNYHLNDKDKIISLFKEAGFTNIFCEYTSVLFSFTKFEEIEFMLNAPSFVKLFSTLDKTTIQNIKQTIKEDFELVVKTNGGFTKEALIVHAN